MSSGLALSADQVRRGDVVRYHPIIGGEAYILVRVLEDPWELGDGNWITKARGINDDKIYRPWDGALTAHRVGEEPR